MPETPIIDGSEREIVGYSLLALGGSLSGLAAALGVPALNHMIVAPAALCGPGAGHCLACLGALVCLAAAAVVIGAAVALLRSPPAGTVARTSGRRRWSGPL